MTRHRRLAGAIIAAAALVAGAGGFLAYRAYSQESAVVTVNGQGIPPTLYAQAQTKEAQAHQQYPNYFTHIDINTLIQQILIDQEATRRGIACTQQDTANFIATVVALAPTAPDGLDTVLLNADLQGVVLPPGYLKTPGAQRTPSTADAVATWAANPTVVAGYTDICTTGRLYNAVTPPNATNDQRNAAIDALLAQLRAAANITSSGSVPVNSPTPYLTPTPFTPSAVYTMIPFATATPPPPHDIVLPAYPSSGSTLDANGKVEVPVSVGGPANAPLNAGGFQIHLRWDASVFTFSSANSTGTIIPSAACVGPVVDADKAGVVFGCVATGGAVATAGAGLLGTVILTPAASGCSALHLFTYGPPDGGNSATGTYTLAPDGSVQVNTYSPIDPHVGVLGQSC